MKENKEELPSKEILLNLISLCSTKTEKIALSFIHGYDYETEIKPYE